MKSIEFQIYDYRETHQTFEDDDDSERETMGEYVIQVFGRTMDGKSVYAKLKDFKPRFYLKVPQNWTNRHLKRMETYLKSKDNRKIWANYRDCLETCSMVKRKKAYGFTNNKQFKFAVLTFSNLYACKKFSFLFELNKVYIPGVTTRAITFKVYEANLTPMLRCFHIQDVPGCGWVEASNFEQVKSKYKDSTCDYEIILNYKDIKPISKESNAPLRICSFDIECDSCDGMFPQANRPKDNIIQIGCTYTYLGKSEPFREYICTLNTCDDIRGAVVESFDDERDLLLAWVEELKNSDADILTGYNIFYFDEKYIMDRAKYLGIEVDIKYLSKLKTYRCPFKEQKLASSALGENLLRYFDTPGLVHIDLMKDVQKTYNLSSYKLDKVASNFIKGIVKEIKVIKNRRKTKSSVTKYQLICDQVNDLHLDDYIHLELMESFVSEDIGEKFKVIKLDTDSKVITIETDLDLVDECDFSRGKIYWSQAKDDVPPKEIFRMQHLGSKERSIVAKYCLKDCRLVNLLINKLEVVTKNIEMANVCYVPLSYLFVRGQGIKLFSLCLKEYRKYGFLFPVVRKPNEDLGSYEGAIVFDPIPNVSYQAYAVKDYASLYPSSIIHKNMSHETKVDDDDFDNLPGVEYFNARFRDETGSWQYRRFAKLEGEFGVVPTILRTLLGERKAVKKQMKVEKDPFKYAILDAKQLALKVTANSLYGQLGASTSPVRERDIAACTTSTGREMLILAKKYDEEILPWIINGLQKAYQKNDTDTIEHIYHKEMKEPDNVKLREQIKKFCEKTASYTFNPIIKYGDSVIGDTPLLLRNKHTNEILIEKIKNLTTTWENYHQGKESSEIKNFQTWTEKGWTDIKRVIRHKIEPSKKLLKIQTHQGVVVVTDEHSLLDKNGNSINAANTKIGNSLLHSFPDKLDFSNNNTFYGKNINEEMAYILGFFMGDGSCGYYETCKKASFAFNNKELNLLENLKKMCDNIFPEFEWKILDTIHSSNVYKLVPKKKKDKLIDFIKYTRKEMYNNEREKKVPNCILNSSKKIMLSFWLGLYQADGFKTNYGSISKEWYNNDNIKLVINNENNTIKCGQQIDQKGTESSLGIYYLAKMLGYQVSINCRNDKKDIYRIRVSNKLRKNPDMIKKITEWEYDESYVYDLTTENHHFHAGVGSLIVHNTDSIFSCYMYRDNTDKIGSKTKLALFQEIIKFGKELIIPFVPKEYQEEFEELYDKYYGDIKNLKLPSSLKVKPEPEHHKTILPIRDRLKQFLKEYLEESYFPWLWTLHDIFTQDLTYLDHKQREEILQVKLFNHGFSQIEKMRLLPQMFSDADKHSLISRIKNFCKDTLKDYYLVPYWKVNSKTNKLEYRMDFRSKGIPIRDKRNLDESIEVGIISGELIKKRLPFPHDLEYEKTFWPYLILTKKRYVGNKYEFDRNKYKLDYMGIVLKRRDNAPIVKEICSGIINKLIEDRDPEGAYQFLEESLTKMFNGEFNIKYFLTSKTLKMKESYADWTRIAHVVLSERIGERDPGNKPQAGDRISFAAIEVPERKGMLQGDRIETPDYIKDNDLKIDYFFYLTNQIEKPALQFLKLAVPNAEERLKDFKIIMDNKRKGQEDIHKYINMSNLIDSCLSTNLYEL